MATAGFHAAIGMSIATLIPIWWIALPLAFISHFFADFYPEAPIGKDNFHKKENLFLLLYKVY